MNTENLTYEAAMARLQDIATRLDQGKLNIDDLANTLKEANALIDFCNKKLFAVEADIKQILSTSGPANAENVKEY